MADKPNPAKSHVFRLALGAVMAKLFQSAPRITPTRNRQILVTRSGRPTGNPKRTSRAKKMFHRQKKKRG